MFLGTEELARLTGVKRKKPLQRKWLEANNIPYTIAHSGELNVLRSSVEQAHGKAAPAVGVAPDLGVFKRMAQLNEKARRST